MPSVPILEPTTIDGLVELSEQGGGHLLPAMIDAFLEDECPTGMQAIRVAITSGDQPAIAKAVHKIRGSAAAFGASRLVAACTELETQAKTGAATNPRPLLSSMEAEIAAVGTALTNYRAMKRT